ncbi:MAG: hypothetical protein KDC83_14585 [Flavobacteriales bacterium]|nr:hypothetical protein [Flavobacteriales bacterium]
MIHSDWIKEFTCTCTSTTTLSISDPAYSSLLPPPEVETKTYTDEMKKGESEDWCKAYEYEVTGNQTVPGLSGSLTITGVDKNVCTL